MAAENCKVAARRSGLQVAGVRLDKGSEKDFLALAERLSKWILESG